MSFQHTNQQGPQAQGRKPMKPLVHPQKFALWLAIGAMTMFFASLTSAIIVKRGDYVSWVSFKMPFVFWISTVIILASSVTLQFAYFAFKDLKLKRYRVMMGLTLFFGLAFVLSQFIGWASLKSIGIHLDGNPSGSFVYVLTLLHAAHLLGGMVILLIAFTKAVLSRKSPLNELIPVTHPERIHKLEMTVTYWHFVGVLWVYLFGFFLFNYA